MLSGRRVGRRRAWLENQQPPRPGHPRNNPPGNRSGRFSRRVKFFSASVTAIWNGRKKRHIARAAPWLSSSASKRVGSACARRRRRLLVRRGAASPRGVESCAGDTRFAGAP